MDVRRGRIRYPLLILCLHTAFDQSPSTMRRGRSGRGCPCPYRVGATILIEVVDVIWQHTLVRWAGPALATSVILQNVPREWQNMSVCVDEISIHSAGIAQQ